jgi:hypothetical protein
MRAFGKGRVGGLGCAVRSKGKARAGIVKSDGQEKVSAKDVG